LGLVGLSGVVVNDSLVLVSHINEMRKKHRGDRLLNIIAAGTADRLRAIVMTTITTVVGLIPLAYGWGGSDPFMAPMALAMGYGLLLVTPLTLVLVPCLYTVALDIQFFGEWIKGKVFGNPEETETS
jgi:multidrug efflux pump subunit AcrB